MNKTELKKALQKAGYREKYAIENHEKITKKIENGEILYIFTYSLKNEYQDANGATWNKTRETWTN